MTTKSSPLSALRKQADQIAAKLKAFERGEATGASFGAKLEAARHKERFKIGIVMDDKIITLEIPWSTLRETSEVGLSEYIVNQMREARDAVN